MLMLTEINLSLLHCILSGVMKKVIVKGSLTNNNSVIKTITINVNYACLKFFVSIYIKNVSQMFST
jgi:hypothetical protein